MKNLVQYIKEEYKKYLIENLKVVFDVYPQEFYLKASKNYSESDIQIYLGDSLLEQLPGDNNKYHNLLGKNYKNIADVYFEYDKFEHLVEDTKIKDIDLDWNEEYDEKVTDDLLEIFKITGLRYIILFDEFELQDDSDNIDKTIDEIFSKLDSSNINKYPIEIRYNSELTVFDE